MSTDKVVEQKEKATGGERHSKGGKDRGGDQKVTDGLKEKLVAVERHSKTVKGGRIMSFSASVVVGDGKGKVGIGRGKAREVPEAIQKAMEDARKGMVQIELQNNTLFHEVIVREGATKIFMKPASAGTGIIAGGAMRQIFEVLGMENVLAKVIGSTNPDNVLRATLKGLRQMKSPEKIAQKRGKTLAEIRG
ncbi:MAG: 30S ribosomal protein S5 [Gammaproteobacteria bacterium]|nr:30S ribosomal protein S5 [Gammaproteobacteria bacterium]